MRRPRPRDLAYAGNFPKVEINLVNRGFTVLSGQHFGYFFFISYPLICDSNVVKVTFVNVKTLMCRKKKYIYILFLFISYTLTFLH